MVSPTQVPHALFVQVWLPAWQVPQVRVPLRHSTHEPLLGRHCGVVPEQAGWVSQVPPLVQTRGVTPTHSVADGRHSAQAPPTHTPEEQSESWLQSSPRSQPPQLIPEPAHEFRLSHEPVLLHW
jgi:hypothetical protein